MVYGGYFEDGSLFLLSTLYMRLLFEGGGVRMRYGIWREGQSGTIVSQIPVTMEVVAKTGNSKGTTVSKEGELKSW